MWSVARQPSPTAAPDELAAEVGVETSGTRWTPLVTVIGTDLAATSTTTIAIPSSSAPATTVASTVVPSVAAPMSPPSTSFAPPAVVVQNTTSVMPRLAPRVASPAVPSASPPPPATAVAKVQATPTPTNPTASAGTTYPVELVRYKDLTGWSGEVSVTYSGSGFLDGLRLTSPDGSTFTGGTSVSGTGAAGVWTVTFAVDELAGWEGGFDVVTI
jgi:hypothetical protein